jgi:hypothetical protein
MCFFLTLAGSGRAWCKIGIVLYAYIDESYVDGRAYLMGALVVTRNQMDNVNEALDSIMWKTNRAHDVPLSVELHGHELFQRTGAWRGIAGKPKLAFSIYGRALSQVTNTGAKFILRGVDRVDRLPARYSTPQPPHAIALQHLLERLDIYANRQGERITVIADQVPDQAHHEARMRGYQLEGTPGYRRSLLSLIEMPIQWEDSAHHRGLQAVDLMTYIYRRKVFQVETHARLTGEVARLADAMRPALEYHNVWTVPAPSPLISTGP